MKNETQDQTVYNYWCRNGCTPKNIKVAGENAKCPTCSDEMKVLGVSTSIAFIGTQESAKR